MAIYSGFSHWKWWFSIAMLIYQRVMVKVIQINFAGAWHPHVPLVGSLGLEGHSIPCLRKSLSWEPHFFVARQVFPWVNPWKSQPQSHSSMEKNASKSIKVPNSIRTCDIWCLMSNLSVSLLSQEVFHPAANSTYTSWRSLGWGDLSKSKDGRFNPTSTCQKNRKNGWFKLQPVK